MPKAMDPSKRFRAVLKCDESKEPRPTFLYPFLTGRQQMAMMEIYEQIDDSAGQLQNMKQAFELAGMFLLGWENQLHPETGQPARFDRTRPAAEQLAEICDVTEAMELAQRVMYGQTLDLLDKKKFDSPSDSATAESAPTAPA